MNEWNFRRGLFGHVILQRYVTWDFDGMEMGQWRDATVADLRDYYAVITKSIGEKE